MSRGCSRTQANYLGPPPRVEIRAESGSTELIIQHTPSLVDPISERPVKYELVSLILHAFILRFQNPTRLNLEQLLLQVVRYNIYNSLYKLYQTLLETPQFKPSEIELSLLDKGNTCHNCAKLEKRAAKLISRFACWTTASFSLLFTCALVDSY